MRFLFSSLNYQPCSWTCPLHVLPSPFGYPQCPRKLKAVLGPTLQELVLGSDWVTLSLVGGVGAEQKAELPAAYGLIGTRPSPPSPLPFSQGIPQGLHSFWRPSLSLTLLPFLRTHHIWFVTAFQRSVLPVGICHQKARFCGTVGLCLWRISA